jgi:hypothetical protein
MAIEEELEAQASVASQTFAVSTYWRKRTIPTSGGDGAELCWTVESRSTRFLLQGTYLPALF